MGWGSRWHCYICKMLHMSYDRFQDIFRVLGENWHTLFLVSFIMSVTSVVCYWLPLLIYINSACKSQSLKVTKQAKPGRITPILLSVTTNNMGVNLPVVVTELYSPVLGINPLLNPKIHPGNLVHFWAHAWSNFCIWAVSGYHLVEALKLYIMRSTDR